MAQPSPVHGISVSQMQALKRDRRVYVPPDEDFPEGHYELRVLPHGPHAPAKKEAQVLRRICSQTGLTPDEVRQHHKYRVELANAAKPVAGRSPAVKWLLQFRRSIQRQTQLPPWHPQYKEAFVQEWDRRRDSGMRWSLCIPWSLYNADGRQAYALALRLTRSR